MTSNDAHRQNDGVKNQNNYPAVTGGKYRSALGRARGWGSAHTGLHHWWMQRLSALALLPLAIWFVWSVVHLTYGAQIDTVEWLQQPVHAILMGLFVATGFYHGALGLQVILEDYVGREWTRMSLTILTKFAAILAGISTIYAILFMSFTSGVQ